MVDQKLQRLKELVLKQEGHVEIYGDVLFCPDHECAAIVCDVWDVTVGGSPVFTVLYNFQHTPENLTREQREEYEARASALANVLLELKKETQVNIQNIENLTIAEARELLPKCKELLSMFGESVSADTAPSPGALQELVGKPVFIRTVTHYYTGVLKEIRGRDLVLTQAAWIGDTGRFGDAMAQGTFREVEPYPDSMEVIVNDEMRSDINYWPHELPRKQMG